MVSHSDPLPPELQTVRDETGAPVSLLLSTRKPKRPLSKKSRLGAGPGAPPKFDAAAKIRYLEFFAQTGLRGKSAAVCGVHAHTVREHELADPEFRAQVMRARQAFLDKLRSEALDRAVHGWQEPVFQGGELVGHKLKKSDAVLLAMLRALVPGYKEKSDAPSVQVATTVNTQVNVSTFDSMDDSQRAALRAFLEALKAKPVAVASEAVPAKVNGMTVTTDSLTTESVINGHANGTNGHENGTATH